MVALKSLDKKIAALESAMQMPPESFYSSVERKLLPHKLKFYKSYLSTRTSSPVSISHSEISVPSVLSISTDMTDLGFEFLKSTEEGLDKVFASRNAWPEL